MRRKGSLSLETYSSPCSVSTALYTWPCSLWADGSAASRLALETMRAAALDLARLLGRLEAEGLADRMDAVHAVIEPLSVHVPLDVGRCGLGFELRQLHHQWHRARVALDAAQSYLACEPWLLRQLREIEEGT